MCCTTYVTSLFCILYCVQINAVLLAVTVTDIDVVSMCMQGKTINVDINAARAHASLSGVQRHYSIAKCGRETAKQPVSLSFLFLFCSLSSSPILIFLINTPLVHLIHSQTRRVRQMNITSLNQCFFFGHQSYLHFLVSLLRCEMTEFCLAALQEETIQPRFKGTIFRGG